MTRGFKPAASTPRPSTRYFSRGQPRGKRSSTSVCRRASSNPDRSTHECDSLADVLRRPQVHLRGVHPREGHLRPVVRVRRRRV
ncbi:hypothetical protein ACFPRL_27385 [Pseudoclavibacter helvolus]